MSGRLPLHLEIRDSIAFAEQLEAHARVGGNLYHSPADLRARATKFRRYAEKLQRKEARRG